MPVTKQEFEQTLTEHLDRLRDEIRAARTKTATLTESARAKWGETVADLEAKQKAARAKLGEVTESTGEAWEHLRDGAKHAWEDLERAVKNAVKEF